MDYQNTLMSIPNSLMAARRRPNLPANYKWQREEFNDENNLSVNKMSAAPSQVLPNGNVVMTNGNVVNATALSQHSNASNSVSASMSTLPGGNTLLSNGNSVSPSPAVAASPAVPVAVVNSNVVMSNGNTVAAKNVAQVPAQMPSPANTQAPPPMPVATSPAAMASGSAAANSMPAVASAAPTPAATATVQMASGNMQMSPAQMAQSSYQVMASQTNLQGACPIAPPARVMNYCTPAPFHSSAGEKFFYVGEAYGRPVAG